MKKQLIVIAGPTASGKTALSIQVAQHFNTVILSADSRQFYREISIGTAKPTAAELAMVPHYFINNLSIHDAYDVGQYEQEAIRLLNELFQTREQIVVCGGSGLFIRALVNGLDHFPPISNQLREQVRETYAQHGIEALQQELLEKDALYASQVDLNNPHRLIRAIEVIRESGKPYSSFLQKESKKRTFETHQFGLDWGREILYQRINQRVDLMMKEGLLEEAATVMPYANYPCLQTVGYAELFAYFNKQCSLAEAVALIKQHSRNYAKRQLTWFRKDAAMSWIKPNQFEELLALLPH